MNRFFKNFNISGQERPRSPEPIPDKQMEREKCIECNKARADIAETIRNFYGGKYNNEILNNLIKYFITLESCKNCIDSEVIKEYIEFFVTFIIHFSNGE